MLANIFADCVAILHFMFIVFVVLGGLLVLKWRWLSFVHIPCALWGILVELMGWICPLTPLELYLRQMAGVDGYHGGFIDHYLMPLIYPAGLTRELQTVFGIFVLITNACIYGYIVLHPQNNKHT